MVCWMCQYFYIKKIEEPCSSCNDKNNFKIWEGKENENNKDKTRIDGNT